MNALLAWHAFCSNCSNNHKFNSTIMHHNKNTQKEIVVIEATVWVLWLLFFVLSYLLTKVNF